MSDENLNNNEETAALFVSTQKKKQAEEEARRKAEEERAKREAAEAEVRRMEEEVEERKRKAEEERKALEEGEKVVKAKGAVKEPAQQDKQKKSPALFIGIAAAAVVLIAVIAVFVGKGGGGSKNYSDLEFNMEYTPEAKGFDIPISYPDSLYTDVFETSSDGDLQVSFQPKKGGDIYASLDIKTALTEKGDIVNRENVTFKTVEEWNELIKNTVMESISDTFPGIEISEEAQTEYNEADPGIYLYSCSFKDNEGACGKVYGWVESNSDEEYKIVISCFFKEKEDLEAVATVADLFMENNSYDGLLMPGANPPENTKADGLIGNGGLHLGLPVPDGQFIQYTGVTNYDLWTDTNGAMIILDAIPTNVDFDDESKTWDVETMNAEMKKNGDLGITGYLSDIDKRTLINEEWVNDGIFGYIAEYEEEREGVPYWEKFQISYWTDITTGEHYFVIINTIAPKVNRDDYQTIFDYMLNNMEDV
ncbi:MAG: hypothetical protein IJU87_08220 [Lachnospiraceae bacterium]|nr:hypothetical protein [Lachnospiraceae bacterium]